MILVLVFFVLLVIFLFLTYKAVSMQSYLLTFLTIILDVIFALLIIINLLKVMY